MRNACIIIIIAVTKKQKTSTVYTCTYNYGHTNCEVATW